MTFVGLKKHLLSTEAGPTLGVHTNSTDKNSGLPHCTVMQEAQLTKGVGSRLFIFLLHNRPLRVEHLRSPKQHL